MMFFHKFGEILGEIEYRRLQLIQNFLTSTRVYSYFYLIIVIWKK